MSALSAFLHPAVPTEEKELVISKRFLGADGKPVPFKIRALTQEENSSLLKASTRKKKVGCWPVSSSNSSPPSTNCPAWMKARTKKQKTDRRGPLGY